MATNFPTNIDTFTDKTSSDLITSAKWNNLQDAIEALEVKVGADNSTVTTSHDYKINTIGKIKARAYRNAEQSIAGRTAEKILIDTISFDTEDVVDVTTNNRIIPNLAGYYQVSGNARLGGIPDGEHFFCSIFKNGERVSAGAYFRSGSSGQGISTVSDLVYMNGTTDYLEIYIWSSSSSDLPLTVGESFQNYISIVGPF